MDYGYPLGELTLGEGRGYTPHQKKGPSEFVSCDKEVEMKKAVTLLALVLVLSAAAAYGQAWLTGSVEDALAKAKAQNKLLLLDFFQESG